MDPISNRTDSSVSVRQNPVVPTPSSAASQASPDSTKASSNQITDLYALAQKAASGPDVRADEVERGKRLVADPNYPSDALLEKLAEGLLNSDDFASSL